MLLVCRERSCTPGYTYPSDTSEPQVTPDGRTVYFAGLVDTAGLWTAKDGIHEEPWSGLPDYDPKNFQGMLAPAGTPNAIVNKLSDEIRKVLQMPQIIERLQNGGMEPYHTGPEKMAAEMKRAFEETAKVVKMANTKVDSL